MLIMFYLTQYIQSISVALCDQYFKKLLTDSLHSFFPKLFEIWVYFIVLILKNVYWNIVDLQCCVSFR